MMKKYRVEWDKKIDMGRIVALKDFITIDNRIVRAGDYGGLVQSEENLSQEGSCWIFSEAVVTDGARIFDDAIITGHSSVLGTAVVEDQAIITGFSRICDRARIFGKAQIQDEAVVRGFAQVGGNAIIDSSMRIMSGTILTVPNLEESIRIQTGLIPCNGEVIAYKQVRKNLVSIHDTNFIYKIGEEAVVENPDENPSVSCSSGLHFSNANYWNNQRSPLDSTFLIASIKLEDIIAVQDGKIRCRKAFILGKYDVT